MNKVAIITGAAGNLGKAVTKAFCDAGYRVYGTIQKGKNFGDEHKDKQVTYTELDLTDEKASADFVSGVAKESGRVDAGVLLVGGFAMGDIEQTALGDVHEQLKLNFDTAYNTSRPLFNQMRDQDSGGRIMMIGSKPALEPGIGKEMLAYTLSKSMLVKYAELLNAEGASHNVVTGILAPSIIDTPLNRQYMPDSNFNDWVTPESIAQTILFFCSEEGGNLRNPIFRMYGNS